MVKYEIGRVQTQGTSIDDLTKDNSGVASGTLQLTVTPFYSRSLVEVDRIIANPDYDVLADARKIAKSILLEDRPKYR